MIIEEDLKKHLPELIAFLNAESDSQRREYLPRLENLYLLKLDEDGLFKCYVEDYESSAGEEELIDISLFEITAILGKLDHLNFLLESTYYENHHPVLNNDFVLGYTIANEHLDVANRLLELDMIKNQVAGGNNLALQSAANEGYLALVNRLLGFDAVKNQIAARGNTALLNAAKSGNLEIVNRLLEFDAVRDQVTVKGNKTLQKAVKSGNLALVNRLLEFDTVRNQITAKDNSALLSAVKIRNLVLVNRLLEFDAVKNQVAVGDNIILAHAVRSGHLEIVKRLLEFEAVKNEIDAEDNRIFRWAVFKAYPVIIDILLSFPSVFAYAEMHEEEYRAYTHSFLSKKITDLRAERDLHETLHPTLLFNVDNNEEIKLLFYMARNLIRQNNPALLDELRFLLEIPALKHLASAEVTPGLSNELLRLALTIGNQDAAEILLNIPAVHELAIANDYYHYEQEGRLNLRQLAQDQESSMHALTISEQERLSSAIQHYQALMNQAGVEHLFQALKAQLEDRYETNPATIRVDGKILNLPLSFEAFQQLKLLEPFYSEALKAYYQNKDHTALRYLSKPNPWMHPDASYVHVNPEQRTQRWSTFEEYRSLILMFWLAAIDKNVAPTEDQTLEGRLQHFIDELAQIGRAHNWDKSRIKVNAGAALDNEQQPIWEEYDDLEGDRPSCFSGVKRRLFQSVIGHPLLQMLTLDIVKQELQDFVRNHFKTLIMKDNQGVLKEAYKTYLIELEVTPTLRQFDIKPESQNDFIANLQKKYGQQFDCDPSFSKYIHTRFQLKTNQKGEVDDAHILNFAAEANIEQLIQSQETKGSHLLAFDTEKSGQVASKNIEQSSQLGLFSQSKLAKELDARIGEIATLRK